MDIKSDTPSVEQSLNQYINSIDSQFDKIENDIQRIKQDEQSIENLERNEQEMAQYISMLSSIASVNPAVESELEEYQNILEMDQSMVSYDQADINNTRDDITKLDPNLGALVNTLLLLVRSSLNSNGKDKEEQKDLKNYIQQVEKAISQQIELDRYQAILSNDKEGKLSPEQVEAYVAKIQELSGSVQQIVGNLENQMMEDLQKDHAEFNQANVDAHSYNIWQDIFCGGFSKQKSDEALMNSLSAMQNLIGNALEDLAGSAGVDPGMLQLQVMLEDLSRKIEKIMQDPKLSLKEKQTQVLALLMYVLGILGLVKAQSEASKAGNEQKMSKAALDVSQMNIDDLQANQKIQVELAKESAITKKIMQVVQIIMFAVMVLLCPSAVFLLLLSADFIMNQLQDAGIMKESIGQMIGDKIGSQIGGEAIYALAELALTGGLSAAGDALVQALAEQSAKEVEEIAVREMAEEIENGAKTLCRNTVGEGFSQEALNEAKTLLETSVRQAAHSAAKKAYLAFMEQSIWNWVSGGVTLGAKKAALAAGKEAAEKVLQEASNRTVAELQQNAAAIIERCANNAAGAVLGIDEGEISKLDSIGQFASRRSALRFTSFGVYALGNTNILSDLAKIIEKKSKDEHLSPDIAILCSLLQSILQMLAMLLSGGGLSLRGSMSLINRLATVSQIGGMGSSVGLDISQGQTYSRQGDVTRAILDESAIADFLHQFLEQLQKNISASRQNETQDIARDRASTRSLSGHLMDGANRGIRVLGELAV